MTIMNMKHMNTKDMNTMTTRQTRKSETQLSGLKWLLTVGSLAAALIGARLLAGNEVVDTTAVAPETATQSETASTPVPTQGQSSTVQQVVPRQIELAPVPTAAAPVFRPVVRSRSSR